MKTTIQKSDFEAALRRCAAAVPTRTTLPVLSQGYLRCDGDRFSLRTSNLDMTVTAYGPCSGEAFSTLIPVAEMLAVVSALKGGAVELTVERLAVAVKSGRYSGRFHAMDTDEFPRIPEVDGAQLTMPAHVLGLVSNAVSFATSDEESRPVLNGVEWEGETFAATNGHFLSRLRVADLDIEHATVIIPRTAFLSFGKLFDAADSLRVTIGPNHVELRSESVAIWTRLIEGPFPNYEQVIPKDDPTTTIEADLATLSDALRRVMITASEGSAPRVRLIAQHGEPLTLHAERTDRGSSEEHVDSVVDGGPLTIALSAPYLAAQLKAYASAGVARVRISCTKPERAALLTPVGENVPELLMLLMPLRDVVEAARPSTRGKRSKVPA